MMKRLFVLVAVIVISTNMLVFADDAASETEPSEGVEEVIDMSSFSDDEIQALLKQVNQEIVNRHIEKTARLPMGKYVCGEDFPAGKYSVVVREGDSGIVSLADSGDDLTKEYPSILYEFMGSGDEVLITCKEGDILEAGCECDLTISTGLVFE